MGWIENIKEFLRNKMEEKQLKASDLAALAGIAPTTMRGMLGNRRPEIKNIIKLANYFDCSIDEVLGRKEFEPQEKQEYMELSPEALSANLRGFITEKMKKNKMTQYELGLAIGRNEDSVRPFLREDDNNQKMLNTEAVIAIADYFKAPIDKMLGRTSQLGKEKQVDISLGNLKTLSPEVLKAAQLIRKSIASDISPKALTTNNVAPSQVSSVIKKSPNSSRGR